MLRTISNGLKEFFTNTDAYRYGGDEFLLIRKDLDTGLFANQLHQMRNRMDELSHSDNKPDIKFSAGYVYGVAETADDLRSMFEKADELMYEVKRQGKEDMLGQPLEQIRVRAFLWVLAPIRCTAPRSCPGTVHTGYGYLVFAASSGAIFCLYSGSLKIWYRCSCSPFCPLRKR